MTRLQLAILATLGSVALLGGAFVFQALGYPPCKMCLWQRWPHAAAIVIGALFLLSQRALLLLAGAVAALSTAAVGLYHAGVEQGFWEGPSTCTSGAIEGLTPEELLNQILDAPLVRCDEIAWQFIGLSMAGWNAVFSLILAVLWVSAYRAPETAK